MAMLLLAASSAFLSKILSNQFALTASRAGMITGKSFKLMNNVGII